MTDPNGGRATAAVVVVRHGETEWSRTGRHTSRTDVPLTDIGEAQAAALGDRLRSETFDEVLTSPRRRATDTCRLAGLGDRAEVCDDLAEWDYGEYEGVTTVDIMNARPGWDLWHDGAPGGEQANDVGIRADRIVARIRRDGGTVLVVSHGHLLRVLAARWVGLPSREGGSLGPLATASVSRLGYDHGSPVIAAWNC